MFGIEPKLNKDNKVTIHHLKVGDKIKHTYFCYNGEPREGIYLGRNMKAGKDYPSCVLIQWHPVEYWGQVSSCDAYDLIKI